MTSWVAGELSSMLKTEVSIGRINIGFLNRIIIDDMLMDDHSGKEMVKIARLSAKYDIIPAFKGKISISNIQLFGFDINLYKPTPESETNFQFVFDALASEDSVPAKRNIDLRINSILIRRGKLAYDVLSEKETPGKFNPEHIKLYNILGNISLKALRNDSINAQIKRFSVDEQSGFELRKLNMKVLGNNNSMLIEELMVDLPGTSLRTDTIHMKYDSLEAFENFMTDVQFDLKVLPSHVTLQDISYFIPVLSNFRDKIEIELDANGTIDQLNCPRINLSAENHLNVRGNVNFQDLSRPEETFIFGKLSNLSANKAGVEFLSRNFSQEHEKPHPFLTRLGDVSFNGEVSGYFTDVVMYGNFRTDLGLVKGDVKLSSDRDNNTHSYSGGLQTENFRFGDLLADNKWGEVTFNLNVESAFYANKYPDVILKGLVESIEYSNYKYENITLDGEYRNGGFDGKAALNDENGSVYINGNINVNEKIPTFNFNAAINGIRPHDLNLTENYEDTEISLKINADFSGGTVEEMIGTIDVDSFLFIAPEKKFYMDNMKISSSRAGGKKQLFVNAGFFNARIDGDYSYRDLPQSLINIARKYVPTLFPNSKDQGKESPVVHNNFSFDINIYNTEILPIVFGIPLSIYSHSTIKGYINDRTNRMRLEGYFPRLSYGRTFIESGLVMCENPSDHFKGRIRLSNYRKNGIVNYSFDTQAQDNEVISRFNWGNNAETTYSGHIEAVTNFIRTENDSLQTVIDIRPTNVILNDTVWNIRPSQIVADPEKIHVNNFNFTRGDQYLHFDGFISDDIRHTAKLELKDINVDYVFDIVNLDDVDFRGKATGYAYISRALKNPIMNTDLFVKNFSFNNALIGDMNIHGEWDDKEEGIRLKADIQEESISRTGVEGYIYPLRPKSGLDLHINAQNTNLKFVEHYIDEIFSNLAGRGNGNVRLYGGFSSLNLGGAVKANAGFRINILNSYITFNDSIRLLPTDILFQNIPVNDSEGHSGLVNGYVRHKNLKDISYRFDINVNNMLVMNTTESADMPFYGTVYATGNALLQGNSEAMNVDAAVTTNRNTGFIYSLSPAASATGNQFIRFVDKTPTRSFRDSIQLVSDFELAQRFEQDEEDDKLDIDVRLNIQVDVTPDATIRIIMDPVSGDYISGRGTGNIRTEYYNKGDIRMFGNYNIAQGIYKFSLQEVIRKDFTIKEGSSINFNGNPLNANMNVQAGYMVNSASLRDLGLDNGDRNPNVRVNCIMNFSGALDRPNIKLALELPNESDETQAQVRNLINTDDDIGLQFLYLLAIGKFYTPDYVSASQSSNMMPSALFSTLSGQLNNMISQIFNNNNWNVGTNLSTGDKGWTDVEIEGVLSAQLLNNRLLINGNFGYRENPLSNTNFVGDFDAEWLLTRSGDIRLKAYNQTNNRIMLRNSLTTQGIGIIFRKDFNRWNDLLFRRRRLVKVTAPELPADTIRTDSIPNFPQEIE